MTGLVWSLMWLPLAANVVLAAAGPRLGRVLPPRVAVRLLPAAMVVVAGGTGAVLGALGFLALAQVPAVASVGDWSPIALRATQPGPLPVEVTAGVAMLFLLASALRQAFRAGRALLRADVACREISDETVGLLVVDDEMPDAYALPCLPGRRAAGATEGRIVVSTAMLRALLPPERRVVLAHETAHLTGHHHLHVQLAELAAAANPLLRASARAVRLAVEREADEAAAAEVGDRRLAARALARAGLAKARASARRVPSALILAATDAFVAHRASALLSPAPRPRRLVAGCLMLLSAVTLLGTGAAARLTDDSLDCAARSASGSALNSAPADGPESCEPVTLPSHLRALR